MRNPGTGEMQSAEVVKIVSAENDPIILRLSDGAILRLNMDVAEVVRFPGTWDAEGHPMYSVKNAVSMVVLDSCPKLRKIK